ncbi:protein-tyrosine phosphatase [Arthrobacter stackebrandtii]|uniref:Protein-tyrosine phosphatase n=1 Tax=Arthrobacter stackebrandtii TaxID=272161 RepID=A0ABS4YS04_9MICC|nr:low molecular weight phosphatase family protein [Arthrobacter stackebrandtii]MBP2411586.1 protein-tyrosine phosphatase [Arthrobacter stackebrandtii]PYG99263.1 low molecular weight phosphatase family protein [Arthrobacter stackebrandtii]
MIHLLTVCTGNICRSPFAERMLQGEMEAVHPGQFAVSSAGTAALAGDGMEEESAELLASFGGSSSQFVSRQLSPAMLAETNLVLAMTVEHRDSVIRMSPRMLKRAFTLVEFARILRTIRKDNSPEVIRGSAPAAVQARWEALPALAASYRSASQPSEAGDDVVDPYRRSPETHRRMVEEILPAVEEIMAFETWGARQP